MKRAFVALILVTLAGGAAARFAFHQFLERPALALPAPLRIDVRAGQPFRQIADELESAGLIPSAAALALWARWKGIDRQIQQGAYQFERPIPPLEILEKMRNGEAMVVRVTFPEGITAGEVARILAGVGIGAEEDYRRLFADPAFLGSLGLPAKSVEGYLFPDTYFFSPLDPPGKVIRTLTNRFHKVFDPALKAEAARLGLTDHEVVTLASIVEKETGKSDERPTISAVFHNRLRLGMPLQSDPTVIYGIENFDGNLTRKHLETATPYNTYRLAGLPPGPIANPGREALLAALRPADGGFLYFVSRNDGSHEFNTNLSDHNRAVNRYQRSRRASPGPG